MEVLDKVWQFLDALVVDVIEGMYHARRDIRRVQLEGHQVQAYRGLV